MGYGDEILAAGQAQRLYDRTGEPVAILDINMRARWHPIWEGNPAILTPEKAARYASFPSIVSAPHARPYIVYPFTVDTGWTFDRSFHARDHVAKIYLTDAELAEGRAVRAQLGPYILIEPWSKHVNLRWPLASWEQLTQARAQYTFVQHLHAASMDTIAGATGIMTASFRAACGLLASASLYVRGESGMCHAAAALGIPQVTIWGACMSWDVLGGYPKQIGLGVDDQPCGSWKPCAHCALAMALISVDDVAHAIDTQLECYGVR